MACDVSPVAMFLAQIYQGLKSLGNGLWTLTNWAKHVICVHTCKQGGLMFRIWDWQSAIVKEPRPYRYAVLSQKCICRNLRAIFRQQMCPFCPFRGGLLKGHNVTFFYHFFFCGASLRFSNCEGRWGKLRKGILINLVFACDSEDLPYSKKICFWDDCANTCIACPLNVRQGKSLNIDLMMRKE